MENLIQKLNQEHLHVFASLDKVKHLGVHTLEGQKVLLRANQRLVKHLQFELSMVHPLASDTNAGGLKRLLRLYKNEIDRFLRQSTRYTEKSFLLSIQGRQSNANFALLLERFKRKLNREQLLISRELTRLYPSERLGYEAHRRVLGSSSSLA